MKNRNRYLYILTWLAYISFSMLAFPFLSITVMLASIPLTMLAGWLYRYKGALVTTAISVPYHYLLLHIHSDDPSVINEAFNPFGIGSLIIFSVSTAWLRALKQRSQKTNAELEYIVAERTDDLHQLTDHLMEMHVIDRSLISSGMLDNPLDLLKTLQKTSSLLCTSLEERQDPETDNAQIVHQHIQSCMESLTAFMSETGNSAEPTLTLREHVEHLAEKLMRLGGGNLSITMDGECDHLEKEITHQLYSIISEAVANAIRHAAATEIKIQCRQTYSGTTICVENDGRSLPDRYKEGMGLPLMRHRARSIGGSIAIKGGAGQRTRLTCTVPLRAAADEKAFPRDGQRLNTKA